MSLPGNFLGFACPEVRFRAHILLLLDAGFTWEEVVVLLCCSSRTIDRWVQRFRREGVAAVAGHKPGRPFASARDGWPSRSPGHYQSLATSASCAADGAVNSSPY
ncbi:MAG: helix-turn-helix domain-containing protein [Planctomycetaceae bacterium]|nr:helix-turn-helix domain-containing protein [Planctomycetaceae bacterium]